MSIYLLGLKSTYKYYYKKFPWSEREPQTLEIISNVKPVYVKEKEAAFAKYKEYFEYIDSYCINIDTVFSTNAESVDTALYLMKDKNTICCGHEIVFILKFIPNIKYLMNHLPAEDFKAWWVENNPETSNNYNISEVLNLTSLED